MKPVLLARCDSTGGAHFALLEGQLALATMIQRARLRLLATRVVPEPMVTLRPRGGCQRWSSCGRDGISGARASLEA